MKALASAALLLALAGAADSATLCSNAVGQHAGRFYTFWHDAGAGCMALGPGGSYKVAWQLGNAGNLVAGTGWAKGTPRRVVRYTARSFDPGSNGYLSFYGWSRAPLVEYYVVDDWGAFTPPGRDGTLLGEVHSDGGTYRIYRARRIDAPSIAGVASFNQYWSVRTERRPRGAPATITFANHVAAWRRLGLKLGRMDYQVLATEGFGSTGRADIVMDNR